MDLYRSFTARRQKQTDNQSSPEQTTRAASQRTFRSIPRAKISSPVALLSTSNVGLNNAQHIAGTAVVELRKTSSDDSVLSASDDDSDTSFGSAHSQDTVTDASSFDNSPCSPEPEPNHLSCYFKPAVDTQSKTPSRSPSTSTLPTMEAPKIPQRVPSHSKRAHESLHRKRSVQRIMSPPATSREITRTSAELFRARSPSFVETPKESPFGHELAQLDEVAEEFGYYVRDLEASEDANIMRAHDLAQFDASDYLHDIQSLIHDTFGVVSAEPCWI